MPDTLIQIPRDQLRGLIRRLRPAMDTNDPALNGIAFSYATGANHARFLATRREMTSIEDVPLGDGFHVVEPIGFFFDATLLDQAASRMGERLQIQRTSKGYVLSDGRSHMMLALRGASDTPFFDVESFRSIAETNAGTFRVALSRAMGMTEDTSDIQGAIQLWTHGNMLYVQSVSRYRGSIRAWVPLDVEVPSYSAVISQASAKSLVDMLAGAETFRLLHSDAYTVAAFGVDRAITISAVRAVDPLRLDQFFHSSLPTRMTVDADALAVALQLVQTYYLQSKSDVPRVSLRIDVNSIVISTPDGGVETDVRAQVEGDPIVVVMNAKYLQSAIHALGRSVHIELSDRNVRISSDSVPYIIICVMPMVSR